MNKQANRKQEEDEEEAGYSDGNDGFEKEEEGDDKKLAEIKKAIKIENKKAVINSQKIGTTSTEPKKAFIPIK